MGLVERDDGWRIPDVLWSQIEPLIPAGKPHPLGCHNPRVPDRDAMTAILFVLRTGCQWNALRATGICSSSSAHRRFVEWTEAGVFEKAWVRALADYDEFVGVDWRWLSMDGAMSKAPLGVEKNRPQPHRPSKARHQAQLAGGPKTYNFPYEPLKSANHGCGFALVGHRRREATIVASCGSFLSAESGPVVVGVNDTDPSNNIGEVTFTVERRAPTAEEWAWQHTVSDGCAGR
jgi:transposase